MTCLRHGADFLAWQRRNLLRFILPLILVVPVFAQMEASNADPGTSFFDTRPRQYLFGDWGGKRTALAEKGITFDFFYISDMQANPSGGIQQTQGGWERSRGTIDINFDRLIQWQGLSFHATGLWQSGVNLGAKIGTLANPSDLDSAHTTRLDSFWLQQLFLDNKVRIRAGQLAGLAAGLGGYLVAALVWGIGLSLGGTTSYAINPARDLGPRLAHTILPIADKGTSGWSYAIVPVLGPLIGGGLAGLLLRVIVK